MSNQKVWFITGASTGLGLALVKLVLANGDRVVATTRNTDDLKSKVTGYESDFLALKVNLTDDENVKSAVKQAIDQFGQLDVVVNNAGYVLGGSIEELTDQEFRATLDVNLFGTVNVIRAALPYLRAQQSGYIINISSSAGYVGYPNAGSYSAGKFAIIGISESLHEEIKPFGVKVTVVAPGEFRTNLWEEGAIAFAKNSLASYNSATVAKTLANLSGKQKGDPEKLVAILFDLSRNPNPPLHLLLGPDAYQLVIDHRKKEKDEINTWKEITLSTNFD